MYGKCTLKYLWKMRHLFGSLLSKGSGQIHYRIFCTVLYWQLFCKLEIFQNNISISVSSDVGWNYTVFQPCQDTGT